MNKKAIIIGFILGLLTTFIGISIYTLIIGLQLDLSSQVIINKILSTSVLGKRASIGVLLNLPLFYYFLNKKMEDYAKGVLLAIIIIAIIFIVNKF
ncbi:hypothetical protein [Lacinutrix sp. 5H-3-7-4]|uniref:hypothetical protein n=1 Tax=Lacinutrix sp. (strain 5H-3-7-4) TaxID=983544 RepID=UPI00020A394E|nr:hypothetical protein [Lacinutrix sp. 5H-3-7-4]AEH00415.1 hypothetical protein Lacal_0564 [Lacinutrix sp. 5H-3-7-4]